MSIKNILIKKLSTTRMCNLHVEYNKNKNRKSEIYE